MYPIAPHISEALWEHVGFVEYHGSLVSSNWPTVDEYALKQNEIDFVLQIDGKTRSTIKIASTANDNEIIRVAKESDAYKKYSSDLGIRKTIIVPNRLINIVLEKFATLIQSG